MFTRCVQAGGGGETIIVRPTIPKMTSNTAPSGTASASTEYSTGTQAYKAFDKSETSYWAAKGASGPDYIQYIYDSKKVMLKGLYIQARSDLATQIPLSILLIGIDENNNEHNITTLYPTITTAGASEYFDVPNNNTYYKGYKLSCTRTEDSVGKATSFAEVEFYGVVEA